MRKFSANITMMELQAEVRRVFNTVSCFQSTDNQLIELLLTEVRIPLNRHYSNGRMVHSSYLHGYVQGVIDSCREHLWKELEFCYLIDGYLYSTAKDTQKRRVDELYNANRTSELLEATGNFYWKKSNLPFTTLTKEELQ